MTRYRAFRWAWCAPRIFNKQHSGQGNGHSVRRHSSDEELRCFLRYHPIPVVSVVLVVLVMALAGSVQAHLEPAGDLLPLLLTNIAEGADLKTGVEVAIDASVVPAGQLLQLPHPMFDLRLVRLGERLRTQPFQEFGQQALPFLQRLDPPLYIPNLASLFV